MGRDLDLKLPDIDDGDFSKFSYTAASGSLDTSRSLSLS